MDPNIHGWQHIFHCRQNDPGMLRSPIHLLSFSSISRRGYWLIISMLNCHHELRPVLGAIWYHFNDPRLIAISSLVYLCLRGPFYRVGGGGGGWWMLGGGCTQRARAAKAAQASHQAWPHHYCMAMNVSLSHNNERITIAWWWSCSARRQLRHHITIALRWALHTMIPRSDPPGQLAQYRPCSFPYPIERQWVNPTEAKPYRAIYTKIVI